MFFAFDGAVYFLSAVHLCLSGNRTNAILTPTKQLLISEAIGWSTPLAYPGIRSATTENIIISRQKNAHTKVQEIPGAGNFAVEPAISPCTESVGIDQRFLAAIVRVTVITVGLDDARRFPITLAKTRPNGELNKPCVTCREI